jgi:SsrA-binding protein
MAKGTKKSNPSDEADKVVCRNRRATFDYAIEERFEAGMVLLGTEVKSLRAGKASINEAFGVITNGEAWLEGAHIAEYPQANRFNHEPTRRRKLLLNKAEIDKLEVKTKERGFTLVPIALYFKNGMAKLELGLAKGKKTYDKRHDIKQRDIDREIERYT